MSRFSEICQTWEASLCFPSNYISSPKEKYYLVSLILLYHSFLKINHWIYRTYMSEGVDPSNLIVDFQKGRIRRMEEY
jgi:hypothetical protein